MNAKKSFKRFWSMQKHTGGFTLVELIVVIAILAILAGVGIPAYSGYITKANMQADITLISEIEHALTLAHYNQKLSKGSYVLLTKEGADADGNSAVEDALIAAFGSVESISGLKYDRWDTELLNAALLAANPAAVEDSTYLNNSSVSELLGNVQTVTSAAAGLLGNVAKTHDDYVNALKNNMGDAYMQSAVNAGIMKNTGTAENPVYVLNDNYTDAGGKIVLTNDAKTQLSNLMVLSVAEELKKADSETMLALMTAGMDDEVSVPSGYSPAATLAARYALYKAVALNQGLTNEFNAMNTGLASANNLTEVEKALDSFLSSSENAVFSYAVDMNSGDWSTAFTTDADAIAAIMQGVDSVSDNYNDGSTLKNPNLYTGSDVSNDLDAYISAAAFAGELDPELREALAGTDDLIVYITKYGVTGSSIG